MQPTPQNTYKVNNYNNKMFIVDAPSQMFAKDSIVYKDNNFIGIWLSFGTFIKYDIINFSNLNIDGDELSIIDNKLTTQNKFKKIMENKSAGLGSVIVDTEELLHYLLKESQKITFSLNKMKYDKICVDDILYNLQNKGMLGITYETVKSIKEMYIPVFDYTTGKIKDIVGNSICFIDKDEYFWMIMPENDNSIYFMSYKGQKIDVKSLDTKINISIFNNPVLTKTNKINKDNFLLFGGFSNLEDNAVVDFYFNDKASFSTSKNKKFSIDVNNFNDYYYSATESPNSLFLEDKTLFKIYGNNKYHLITGLLMGQKNKSTKKIVTTLNPNVNFRTITDIDNKDVYINCKTMENNGFTEIKPNI